MHISHDFIVTKN